jgi:hypothetical protein
MDNDMTKCWYQLNLNVENAISKDWKFPKNDGFWGGIGVWAFKQDIIFNSDWVQYMSEIALPIKSSVVFYRKPNLVDDKAHVDLLGEVGEDAKTTYLGFNWVFGGKGSEMIWYDLPLGERNIQLTPAGNKFLSWQISDLVEVDRCSIRNVPTLVRIDYPHSIKVGDEERWCISARTSLDNLTWDEAVEHLKTKNIIIDR